MPCNDRAAAPHKHDEADAGITAFAEIEAVPEFQALVPLSPDDSGTVSAPPLCPCVREHYERARRELAAFDVFAHSTAPEEYRCL